MHTLASWVKETTATTGSGLTLTLGGAVSGFVAFSAHPSIVDGTTVYYDLINGSDREQGIGTWHTGNLLDRTTPAVTLISGVIDNTSPSRITLSGTSQVMLSLSPTVFSDIFASPSAIGSTTPAAGTFTTLAATSGMVAPKTSGAGIKVDTAAPTFGWADLVGDDINSRNASSPTFQAWLGNIYQFGFKTAAGIEELFFAYHLPHDYVPETNIFIHIHCSCAASATGNVKWYFDATYAKGHNQAAFPAAITTSLVSAMSATAYKHLIQEVQLSTAGGSGTMLNTTNLEPDGLIILRLYRDASDVADTSDQIIFVHAVDIHYQTTGILGTKQKTPDFYT